MGDSAVHVGTRAVGWLFLLLAIILVSLALQLAGEAIGMRGDSGRATVTVVAPSDSSDPCDIDTRFPADVLVAMTMDELLYLQSTLCPNQ